MQKDATRTTAVELRSVFANSQSTPHMGFDLSIASYSEPVYGHHAHK